jgi:hypothetical protein
MSEKQRVYVVMARHLREWSDYSEIVLVSASQEAADRYVEQRPPTDSAMYSIDVWELDGHRIGEDADEDEDVDEDEDWGPAGEGE